MDVRSDGIALYEDEDTELHEPKPKTPAQALAMANEYFEVWFPSAQEFYDSATDAAARGRGKLAAFLYHQASERLYHCVLLVSNFYTPHVHNLAFLRTQAERLDRRLVYVWPNTTRADRARFEKLKEAYVKSRYSNQYQITDQELEWLRAKIEELGRVVLSICQDRILKIKNQINE